MPWTTKADVARHNKRAAENPKLREQFKAIANSVLAKTGSDSSALRIAPGVIKKQGNRRMALSTLN